MVLDKSNRDKRFQCKVFRLSVSAVTVTILKPFVLSALPSFYVNKVSFRWASMATIFLFFQCFTFWSGIISFGQANFFVLVVRN